MDNFKIVIFIMAILISLTAFANKRKLPYPVLLAAAGLIIGFVPGLHEMAKDPRIIFVIIIPSLLYGAASKTFYMNSRPLFDQFLH